MDILFQEVTAKLIKVFPQIQPEDVQNICWLRWSKIDQTLTKGQILSYLHKHVRHYKLNELRKQKLNIISDIIPDIIEEDRKELDLLIEELKPTSLQISILKLLLQGYTAEEIKKKLTLTRIKYDRVLGHLRDKKLNLIKETYDNY